jgi:hypothetical protein
MTMTMPSRLLAAWVATAIPSDTLRHFSAVRPNHVQALTLLPE